MEFVERAWLALASRREQPDFARIHVCPAGGRDFAAGIGFGIAVIGGAIGQSRIGAAACEGAARNPGAAGRIQTMMILGLALIESLVLFALVVVFAVVKGTGSPT